MIDASTGPSEALVNASTSDGCKDGASGCTDITSRGKIRL